MEHFQMAAVQSCLDCGEIFGEPRRMDGHLCIGASSSRIANESLPESTSGLQLPSAVNNNEPKRKVRILVKDGRLQLRVASRCDKCLQEFWNLSDLERHTVNECVDQTKAMMEQEMSHEMDEEGNRACNVCGDIFVDQMELREHIIKEHLEPSEHSNRAISDNLLEALESGKEAELRAINDTDTRSITPIFTCTICSANFSEKSNLFEHTATIHNKRVLYECTKCEIMFVQRLALSRHMQGHASFKGTGIRQEGLQCHFCGMRFPFESYLRRHVATHTEDSYYTCELCGQQFRSQGAYVLHRAKHTGDQLHPCPKCGKVFPYRSSLERHYKTHISIPSQCPHCEKVFTVPALLQKHVDIEHSPSGTTLICPHCPRKFLYPSYLERHLVTHLQTRDHECPICHRRYSIRGALLSHLRRHLPNSDQGENPFKCTLCDQSYRHESTLEKHMERAHGEVSSVGMVKVSNLGTRKTFGEWAGSQESREHGRVTQMEGTGTSVFVD